MLVFYAAAADVVNSHFNICIFLYAYVTSYIVIPSKDLRRTLLQKANPVYTTSKSDIYSDYLYHLTSCFLICKSIVIVQASFLKSNLLRFNTKTVKSIYGQCDEHSKHTHIALSTALALLDSKLDS